MLHGLRLMATLVLISIVAAPALGSGDVQFLDDVYDRDSRVLEALDGDFTFVAPSGASIKWPMDG